MSVASNYHFWMYTFMLFIFWVIVLTNAFNKELHLKGKANLSQNNTEAELENTGICKNLCGQCDCLGFFCGEECICECNNKHYSKVECIGKIQVKARNLSIPFEILIQGPKVNNFMRNTLQFEQNQDKQLHAYLNNRSTITIYKPNKRNQNPGFEVNTSILNGTENLKNRRKRCLLTFNLLRKLRNNFLPPPLLGSSRSVPEDTETPEEPSIMDEPSVPENNHNFLIPKPKKKQKSSPILGSIQKNNSQRNRAYSDDNGKRYKNCRDGFQRSLPAEDQQEESQEIIVGSSRSNSFEDTGSLIRESVWEALQKLLNGKPRSLSSNEKDYNILFSEEQEKEESEDLGNLRNEQVSTDLQRSAISLSPARKFLKCLRA